MPFPVRCCGAFRVQAAVWSRHLALVYLVILGMEFLSSKRRESVKLFYSPMRLNRRAHVCLNHFHLPLVHLFRRTGLITQPLQSRTL